MKDWLADVPTATLNAKREVVFVYPDRIERTVGFKKEPHPLEGVVATYDGDETVTVTGPDFSWTVGIKAKKAADAVAFIAALTEAQVARAEA